MSDEKTQISKVEIQLDNETVVTHTWATFTNDTNKAPDTDTVLDVRQAKEIAIQIDTTDGDNTSGDVDINVLGSLDGTVYDNVPYVERNIGDNEKKTFLVEPGPAYLKLRADENNDGNAVITTKTLIKE